MGGSICVGIRRRDGSEHILIRHTNSLPYWWSNKDFLEDGQSVDKYIKPKIKSWCSSNVKIIKSSEYGVVLFDFISKKVFSRQGYSSPGRIIVNVNDIAQMYNFGRLLENNMVTKIENFGYDYDKEISIGTLDNLKNKALNTSKSDLDNALDYYSLSNDSYNVYYNLYGLSVDHNNGEAFYVWDKVRSFIKDNKWKSKIRSTKATEKEFQVNHEDE